MPLPAHPAAVLSLAAMLLGGCVYLPETTVRYDDKCGIYERKMTMQWEA